RALPLDGNQPMKKLALVALVVVVLGGGLVLDLLLSSGYFKTIAPHFAGRCRPIGGMPGPEDVTVNPDTGVAYISSADRRARGAGRPTRGAIYALDLESPEPRPIELTGDFQPELQPHGLSLLRGPYGEASLFVVNHPGADHTVEIFDVREGKLAHRETIRGELLRSPNDVLAVGPRQFYVTNDHRHPTGWKRTASDFLRLADSDVVFFDGTGFRVVAEDIAYPNGITMSPDGRTVFVASTTERAILSYERNPATGALSFRERFDAGTGVDNLEMGSDGTLWEGAHPQMLAFLKNARDPANLSPSQVLSLDPSTGVFQEQFLSLGDDLSTSSVAAVHGRWMLIGSVFEEHLLLCETDQAFSKNLLSP
ncbi:MAG: strictosidine synthase family protein, partial [Vicinamibacteria bacterium]